MELNPVTQGPPAPQGKPNDGSKWALERLLGSMPQDIAQSFNEDQRLALQAALITNTRKRHPVDLRWSIPFLRRQFYLVLLMGEEERSKARRRERSNQA